MFKIHFCVILVIFIWPWKASTSKVTAKDIVFQQSDYVVTFERGEITSYNKSIFKYASMVTFKYNRTTPALNASFAFKVDLENNMEIIIQAYKFLSNEYRHFPLRFQINMCDALNKNVLGVGEHTKCGNFSGCPILKNTKFHICNWTINQEKILPLMPNGRYMLDIQGIYFGAETGVVRFYGEVDRPISYH